MSYLDDFCDEELLDELEDRGYYIGDDKLYADVKKDIEKLYLDYITIGGGFFDKQLKAFFTKHLDKTFV